MNKRHGSQEWRWVRKRHAGFAQLGDFSTTWDLLPLSAMAILVGAVGAFIALALLRLIGLFTNLFFFQHWSETLVSPAGHHLGAFVILVPVVGGLLVGLMARFGSERIRGHGIPEAIEAILIKGSRIAPRVAIWKPISSAVSIGSGGPFGAEGPIIMTGGAFGSIAAQCVRLTSVERRILLVAGAAAGMSATFAAPVSAVLLSVELLLFEWKPRSFVPVACASATAAFLRRSLLGMGPLFPVPAHDPTIGFAALLGCVLAGLLAGALSALLTWSVYAAEDAFRRLPIHWMWWPAIGGAAVGLGGFFFPQTLGVGYDTIGRLLSGGVSFRFLFDTLLAKWVIWAIALGSGTSGGVLAPLLMMGGALGGIEGMFLPSQGAGFWALISMGAILGGTMRSPLTGVVFAFELTHDVPALFPLLVATIVAHAFTVLVLRRSILTEKISRRGYHLTREYATDPLETVFVDEVMRTNIAVLPEEMTAAAWARCLMARPRRPQRLYPVVDRADRLVGVVTRGELGSLMRRVREGDVRRSLRDVVISDPVEAFPDEPVSAAVGRMAVNELTRLVVVRRDDPRRLVGIISLTDVLRARQRHLEEERRRQRPLSLRRIFHFEPRRPAFGRASAKAGPTAPVNSS